MRLGCLMHQLEYGYYRIEGTLFAGFVVVVDEVALSERDSLLGFFFFWA